MPGPSMCAGVCVWRRRKGREGGGGGREGEREKGAISLCRAMRNLFHSTPTQLNLLLQQLRKCRRKDIHE